MVDDLGPTLPGSPSCSETFGRYVGTVARKPRILPARKGISSNPRVLLDDWRV